MMEPYQDNGNFKKSIANLSGPTAFIVLMLLIYSVVFAGSKYCLAVERKESPEIARNSTAQQNSITKPADSMENYMKNMQKKINSNWYPVNCKKNAKTVVIFKIEKDGTFRDVKVKKSSKNAVKDQEAVDAVVITAHFWPLPVEYKYEIAPVEFTFDYKVHNLSKKE